MEEKRICKKCGQLLDLDNYYLCNYQRGKAIKQYYKTICKKCSIEIAAQWNKDNKERKNENHRKCRANNINYRNNCINKAKIWREQNYEQYRKNIKKWQKEHYDLYLNYPKQRRARILSAPINDLTQAQWEEIKKQYQYRCVYCGKKTDELTRDHIIPLLYGGSHTMNNIVPACRSCNSKKGAHIAPTFQMALDII